MIKKVIIIAEAGVNHNGNLNIAKKLVDVAVNAGADYVKFQTFKAKKIVSLKALKAGYQLKNTRATDNSQFEMLKKLELSEKEHFFLQEYCVEKGIGFFSTAFDVEGVIFLDSLGFKFHKCPSGEITNYPYLKALAQTRKPIVLSTGMATLAEIEEAIIILEKYGCLRESITVLHCNTAYPTPFGDVNLKAMHTIACAFGVDVGYSDHTLGIEVAIAAVALGAKVIEKHFTLDSTMSGPDHKASLEPDVLKKMVAAIRNIEKSMAGNGRKEPTPSELKNKEVARKSIHLAKELIKGSMITEEDLIPLRPGNGISPMHWDAVIGREIKENQKEGYKLEWVDIK